jgi:hypothetical protein
MMFPHTRGQANQTLWRTPSLLDIVFGLVQVSASTQMPSKVFKALVEKGYKDDANSKQTEDTHKKWKGNIPSLNKED